MTRVGFVLTLSSLLFAPAALAQAPQADPPTTTVDASRGGVTIASGVNSLTIGARAQFRWTLHDREQLDADTEGAGVGREDDPMSQFDVPRVRVALSGGVFRPWFRYDLQFELSRAGGEGGSRLKDALVEIRPPGRDYRLRFGQFKVPFGLQLLTSSGRLQFVDRAITERFTPGRDMGVMFGGTLAGDRVGYDAGVFNGSGESVRQANSAHLWAARVYVDPIGQYTLAESAADAGDRPVLHLGAAIRGGEAARGRTPAGIVDEPDNQLAYNVEFAFKTRRFFSTAEHFWMVDERTNPVAGPGLRSRGYHVQAGVMLVPRTVDVGVLYATVDPDTDIEDAAVTELRGVVGYFWQAHNLKLQADIGRQSFGPAFSGLASRARQGLPSLGARLVSGQDLSDTQLRAQLSFAF